jgi:hypothetical protein
MRWQAALTRRRFAAALLAGMVGIGACGAKPRGAAAAETLDGQVIPSTVIVTSAAFAEGDAIPVRFTCQGDDVSPPLAWSGVPTDAAALALVVDDPDAPRGTYVHWVVVGIAPDARGLAEGESPPGATVAQNSAGRARWSGPCPPGGKTHRYRFTLYALRARPELAAGAATANALDAVRDTAVARGRLVGVYQRG